MILSASTLVVCGIAIGQVRGVDLLGGYARALAEAQTFKASYSLTQIGGVTSDHQIEALKPNRFRLENSQSVALADGKDLFVLDKQSVIYYQVPATEEFLKPVFATSQAEVFVPFFKEDAYAKVVNPKATGAVRRKGLDLEGVRFSPGNDPKQASVTYYLPRTDNLIRQAELLRTVDGKQTSIVLDTRAISVGDPIPEDRFSWTTPENALALSYELAVGKAWFSDIEQAKEVARRTKKILFLNFYAGTCRGCQVLKQGVFSRPDLMALSKYFVLCEIDIQKQQDVARSYDANSHPIFKFYRHDGTLLEDQRGDFGLDDMLMIFRRVLDSEK